MSAQAAPRVAIIGARRVRQGLGPFVANKLAAAGAEVAGFLVSRPESLEPARVGLAAVGADAPGALDFDGLLEFAPDAVAILSPSPTHGAYLERALDAGLHVLCEKPLLWPPEEPGVPASAERAQALAEAFASRGLLLAENCQWPYVLPAFRELHPSWSGRPTSFTMHLSPASTGLDRLGDCLPHPLSLLQALAPGREVGIEDLEITGHGSQSREVGLDFAFLSDGHAVRSQVLLRTTDESPRPAGLSVNGLAAERLIRERDYAMFLSDGSRLVDLADPLGNLVTDFVRALDACRLGRETDSMRRWRIEIPQRARLLQEIARHSRGADR